MVNINIDIFEMSYEESVSYFKRLENMEKPGKQTLAFLFKEINAIKRQLKPEKTASSKKGTEEG
jgi:hypothetical protein